MDKLITLSKRLFKRLSLREQVLVLLFLLVILCIWGGDLLSRAGEWKDRHVEAKTELITQQQWLDRSEEYTIGLARSLERVDPEKTYSAAQLSGRIDALLRKAALAGSADIDPVKTREGEIFNDHDVRVRLSRISLAQFIQLNELFSKETPYINLTNLRVTKNRRNPEELDVRLEINSFDLKSQAL